jgi:O-antigen ligase/tetratricopeptide (TPR) repeat protein
MTLETVLRRLVIVGVFLVPFVPLIVANQFFFPFITGKNFAFRIIVESIFGAWVLLALLKAEYRPRGSWILYALSAFVGVILLADALSPNAFKSFWSNFERMEGGIGLLHLFAYFVVLVSVFKSEKLWGRLAATSLGVSAIVGGYSLLQLAGAFEIHQGGLRIDATLGNATYFAAYMLFHCFIALVCAVRSRGFVRWALIAFAAFAALLIFFSATRGTTLGLIGGISLAALLAAGVGSRASGGARKVAIGGVIALVVLIGGFLALKEQPFIKDSPLFGRLASISLEQGQTRFTIWSMAWEGFLERPVLGWGQESFNYVFNEYYRPSLYGQEPWFDRAHNVFMDWLVAGGILGLLGYLSLFGIAVWWLLFRKENPLSIGERALFTGLLAGYFVHNLFVFDNLTSSVLFISIIAYLAHRYDANQGTLAMPTLSAKAVGTYALPVATLLTLAVVYLVNVPGMKTAHGLIQVISPQSGGIAENVAWAERTVAIDALGRQEVGERLVETAFQVARQDLADQATLQALAAVARAALEKEVARAPDDARLNLFLGSYLRQTGDFDAAATYLAKARALSPAKQYIRFELGLAAYQRGDVAGALGMFKEAFELEPRFDTARIYYAVMAMYAGDQATADRLLAERFGSVIVANDYVYQAYVDTNQVDRAVAVAEKYVEENPADVQRLMQLANVYRLLGRTADAIAVARQVGDLDASLKAAADAFILELAGAP